MRMYKTWTKNTVMRKQTKEEKKIHTVETLCAAPFSSISMENGLFQWNHAQEKIA